MPVTPAASVKSSLSMQVYQNISAYTSRLDNVVELYSRVPVPSLPGLPPSGPVVTTATLRHAFEPIGGSTSQITFEDTEVKTTGDTFWSGSWLQCCSTLPGWWPDA